MSLLSLLRRIIDRKYSTTVVAAVALTAFAWGMFTYRFNVFPYGFLKAAQEGAEAVRDAVTSKLPWYYVRTEVSRPVQRAADFAPSPGLTLITGLGNDDVHYVRVVDADGAVVHEWKVDWFDIWPDATHVPDDIRPVSRPGASVHGTAFLDDGSVAFNFEYLGLVRLDVCGNVVWRLPYQTHHSLSVTDRGTIWASGRRTHSDRVDAWPGYAPPFFEETVVEVSPDGSILREISVFEILKKNDLLGFLYMNDTLPNSGDVLHLNDVEEFPRTMKEGVFRHGDLMVSLNFVNSVFVFDPQSLKIRFISTGEFVHQHDPDFVDGNTIVVFDNNVVGASHEQESSRIMLKAADSGALSLRYQGTARDPFFTPNLGRLQALPGGNMLIVEARRGRVFEIDSSGRRVWQYDNLVREGVVGIVEDAQRLPLEFDRAKFGALRQACSNIDQVGEVR